MGSGVGVGVGVGVGSGIYLGGVVNKKVIDSSFHAHVGVTLTSHMSFTV